MAKYTQAQVHYRRGYPLRGCAYCSMFRRADAGQYGRCSAVTGQITPYGYCDIFDRVRNPFGHKMTRAHRDAMDDIYDHAHGYSVAKNS